MGILHVFKPVGTVPDRAKYLSNMILWKLNSNPQSSKPTHMNLFMLFILANLTFLTFQPLLGYRLGIIFHLLENSDLSVVYAGDEYPFVMTYK